MFAMNPMHESEASKIRKDLEAAKLREASAIRAHADEQVIAVRMQQERDAALSALEIARNRIVEIWHRVDLGQREGALGIIGIALTEIDANPSAALAERDRAIERGARNAAAERASSLIDLLSCSGNYAGTQFEKVLEDAAILIRREFNLEPKPEGE